MRNRTLYLLSVFVLLLILMMLQKPVFLIVHSEALPNFSDILAVVMHGSLLDMSVAGYMMAVPAIVVFVSIFLKSCKLRAILTTWYVIVSLILSTAFISDLLLYDFWKFKLDASVLFYLQSPEMAFASVSSWYIVSALLLILLCAAITLWLLLIITPKQLPQCRSKVITTCCLTIILCLDFVAIRGGFGRSTANVGKVYFSSNTLLNHSAVNPVFSFLYSLAKAEDFGKQFQSMSDRECEARFNELYPCITTDSISVSANISRPNILLIILEGFGTQYISSLGGASNIAPTLNSLVDSAAISFTNCYGNSFRTDRGLVSVLSGHLSYPTTSIMKMPAKSQTLPGIAQALKSEGYNTEFVYGGDINFTNMQSYLRSGGFDSLISDSDFSLDERKSNAWGVGDHIIFDYLYNDLSNKTNSPWFVTLLTLSSHEPFEVPFDKFPNDKMANAAAYTDAHLGAFLSKLKSNQALWDSTLVVITADHGKYYITDEPITNPKYFTIPLIFTGGALSGFNHTSIDYPVAQSDIAATLLEMVGISASSFPFSRNVLGRSYANATHHHAIYTFQNGYGIIRDSSAIVVDNESQKIIYETNSAPQLSDSLRHDGEAVLQYIYTDLSKR